MRNKLVLGSFVALLAMMCAVVASAQDTRLKGVTGDNKYLISAKAGGVNFVSGTVTVTRKDSTAGRLVAGESLQIGDRVTTGSDGRAEILLNPGSYLRVGGDSSFEFLSTDLEDLQVELHSGSAILEVFAADEFRVSLKTPKTELALTRTGVYRLDVQTDGNARLSVFKGKAFVGANSKTSVGGGKAASFNGGEVAVAKFDRGDQDPLDVWSKERGKDLMKANAQLQQRTLRNSLLSSFNQRGWNMYDSFGVWVYDASRRMSCFLPFGYGWSSPYGWGYNADIWWFGLPQYVYRVPYQQQTAASAIAPSGSVSRPAPAATNTAPRPVPSFIRLQGTGEAGTGAGVDMNRRSDPIIMGGGQRGIDTPIAVPSAAPAPSVNRPAADPAPVVRRG
ncbi:MAG TPA: FecR family protein, partial [Pyrinomonadaceae bacterium]|nr:FecR family protein [Pyrinomonadaceae bacterium]